MLNKVITTNQKLDAEYQALNLREPDQLTLETLILLTRRRNSIKGAIDLKLHNDSKVLLRCYKDEHKYRVGENFYASPLHALFHEQSDFFRHGTFLLAIHANSEI